MQNKITFKNIALFIRIICLGLCVVFTTSSLNAQTVSTASGTGYDGGYGINDPGTQSISFVIQNTTATSLLLTTVNSQVTAYFTTQGSTVGTRLYASSTSLSGPYDISQTSTWTLINTGSVTLPSDDNTAILTTNSNINYIMAAGAQIRFVLDMDQGIAFSYTPVPTPNIFTNGGVSLKVGDNQIAGSDVGYIAVDGNSGTANSPLFFGGSVVLSSTVPCAGVPAPGNTISSTGNTVCSGSPLTLSPQNATAGTGVTYAWEDSSSATGAAWVPAPTPNTNSTLTTTQAVVTWYRVNVTCSGNTATSTPVKVDITPLSGCYCAGGASITSGEKIANVTFGTLNNSSTSTVGYENFTTLTPVPSFVLGSNNPISVTGNASTYFGDAVNVWIDFNQNGNFGDPGELVYSSGESSGPYNGNITIPTGATLGNTRMRVRLYDDLLGNGINTPCGTADYGQVEDYTISLVPCVVLSFTTQPANASTSCGGTASFTVGLSGSVGSIFWEYKTSATDPNWKNITNGGIYSGATTATLKVTNTIDSYNGYLYRAVVTGVCSGTEFTNSATLTVNQLTPVISPASVTICNGSIQALTLTNTLNNTDLVSENFDGAALPTGWAMQNNSSPLGAGTWFKGNPAVFASNSGDPDSYFGCNYQSGSGNATLSNWLFTPTVSMKNGDVFTFYTRTTDGTYPDRLEVRASVNGASTDVGATATSVGDYTNLLLTINSGLTSTGYPITWTKQTVTISGVTGTISGRIAFRYYVTSGGTAGSNSDYIGIDDVVYTSTGGAAQGVWTTQTTPPTIFTDASATIPYVAGALANKVYVTPTATTTYSVTYQTLSPCTSKAGTVTVTVTQPITGTSTTSNQVICTGGTATFTASAPTSGSPILHQWKVSTDNGATFANVTNTGVYSGATTASLKITAATVAMNNYKYKDSLYVTVCGSNTVTNIATLTVNPKPVIVLSAAPYKKLYPGLTTTITAAVSPNPASTYTWFRNGTAVPNVTGNSIVVDVDHLGAYTVTVNDVNTCSSTSSAISISDSSNTTLFIYPSPSTGQFQVRYYNNPPANRDGGVPGFVNVFDSKGARVWSKAYSVLAGYTRMDVDLTNFSKGIYRVELTDTKGNRIKTGSVVIF